MERGTPYMVYTPDGRRAVERSFNASGPWAVAYARHTRGRWSVLCVVNSSNEYEPDADTMAMTAERISERDAEALERPYGR